MTNQQSTNNDEEMTFITHLLELRDRLLRMVLSIIIIFLCLFYFANDLYSYLAGPLLAYMPEGSQMIAIDVASPFLTPFKLAMVMSIFIAMPYILFQLWGFVAPGLYQHERRLAAPLVVVSSALFYAGMAFAYYVVFPLVFGFLTGTAPEGVSVMTDITRYLDFVLTIFFAFGIAFQVPVATILLVWTGAISPAKLASKRPYVIVGAFVIGMVLTPPDFISQTLLAIPMWMLFEIGILASRFYVPAKRHEEDEDEEHSIGGGVVAAGATAAGTAASAAPVYDDEDANESGHEDHADDEIDSNDSGHQDYAEGDDEYRPLTDEEMDEELDRIDAEMDELDKIDDEDSESDDKEDKDKKDKKDDQ